eukprot:gnl/Chilomastix_caulleri/3544.p1 GENE.gnl/Chilomastix_caulleri/3544~~gnl/Chilomastix_caulleri/3544.p1  ORF type:complete len:69 (+),score=30.38 gnl/Chilomastix_caulleri/3544:238-444(+)
MSVGDVEENAKDVDEVLNDREEIPIPSPSINPNNTQQHGGTGVHIIAADGLETKGQRKSMESDAPPSD